MERAKQSKASEDDGGDDAGDENGAGAKEQEKEGFSIPAQLKLLKEYAAAQGFTVAQELVDVETAKQLLAKVQELLGTVVS